MHITLSHKLLSTCLCRLPMSVGAGMSLMILSCVYQQVSLIFSSKYHLFFPAFSMHSTWAASWSHFRMMPGKGWPLYMTTQYCPSSLFDRTTGHSHLLSAAVFEVLKIPGIDIPMGTVLAFLGRGPLASSSDEMWVTGVWRWVGFEGISVSTWPCWSDWSYTPGWGLPGLIGGVIRASTIFAEALVCRFDNFDCRHFFSVVSALSFCHLLCVFNHTIFSVFLPLISAFSQIFSYFCLVSIPSLSISALLLRRG